MIKIRTPFELVMKVSYITTAALVVYALLMKLFGLFLISELRLLNVVIIFFAIRFVLRKHRELSNGNFRFFHAMGAAFAMTVLTSIMYSSIVLLYVAIDHNFLQYLKDNEPFGSYLDPGMAAIVIVVEGVSSGAVISYALAMLMDGKKKFKV